MISNEDEHHLLTSHGALPAPADLPALVCVASSAGGITALAELLDRFPADLPVAIIVVQHLSPDHQSRLAEILARHTTMTVKAAADGDRIAPGFVYVAPPGSHLIVTQGKRLRRTHTGQVHFVRPSADLLLQSAAKNYPGRLIAVVLTGMGRDGADGVRAVRAAGGTVIAQNPESATFGSMPASAIATGDVHYVLQLEDIAQSIAALLEAGATP